jgi:osmoprotectant transport system permease protein
MNDWWHWPWVQDNTGLIVERLAEHLQLTLLAVLFGLLIAFPLALLARHWPRLHPLLLGITGVAFTIPALALFILLIPLTGLSAATALIGLTLYTLLILFRNVVTGLESVPAEVRDAATAMGYGAGRRLWQVEIPLALPAIIAGIRIATVTTIGLVTVTALIGQGGLGQLFIQGFTLHFPMPLIVGFSLSIVLAVLADLLLVGAERVLTPWQRRT